MLRALCGYIFRTDCEYNVPPPPTNGHFKNFFKKFLSPLRGRTVEEQTNKRAGFLKLCRKPLCKFGDKTLQVLEFLGAKAPLQPGSSDGLSVCM